METGSQQERVHQHRLKELSGEPSYWTGEKGTCTSLCFFTLFYKPCKKQPDEVFKVQWCLLLLNTHLILPTCTPSLTYRTNLPLEVGATTTAMELANDPDRAKSGLFSLLRSFTYGDCKAQGYFY